MTPHDSTHERELEELLTRDDAEAEEALRSLATECARCAQEVEDFHATAASLDAALGADAVSIDLAQEEILAAARTAPLGSREGVIEAGIRVGALPLSARQPRRGFLVPAAALSAAAIALFSFWLARTHTSPATTPISDPSSLLASNTGVDCEAPVGEVAAFDTFTWSDSATRDEHESYTLIIRSLDETNADGSPVEIRVPDRTSASFALSASQRAAVGRSIEWEVWICDATGTATARFGRAKSALSSR
ncbi:MAG: hypothetical protein IPH13_15940 [Planctomycetes bacterium]|nr:hypothetical protein [Planctomycetota bacterium]MCC7169216.1 hypothetical protein [Planctomycetota bacterium]